MQPLIIKEDFISRKWLSSDIFKKGINIIRKWRVFSFASFAGVVTLLYLFHIPKRLWLILFIPAFPIYIALSIIIFSRLFVLPQTWILENKFIRARGFRLVSRIVWSSVHEWSVEPIHDIVNYYRLQFKWKKMYGIAGGTHIILIPPSISIEEVVKCFEESALEKRKVE